MLLISKQRELNMKERFSVTVTDEELADSSKAFMLGNSNGKISVVTIQPFCTGTRWTIDCPVVTEPNLCFN